MKKYILPFLFVLILSPFAGLNAKEKNDTIRKGHDTVHSEIQKPYHWNVIKFNPTPMIIQAVQINNITLSYERLITRNMSLCLQVGYLVFPKLVTDTVAHMLLFHNGKKYGVNLALDYRFYPLQRNRRPAPDGLYIGAYTSYYGFHFSNSFSGTRGADLFTGNVEGRINVINMGVDLGYQFVFWKRFTLDLLLFGPSVSVYSGTLDFNINELTPDQIANIDQELVDKLLSRFPMLRNLFTSSNLEFTGTRTSWGLGFRYSFQLGFHF
jgi:hypothetical protein